MTNNSENWEFDIFDTFFNNPGGMRASFSAQKTKCRSKPIFFLAFRTTW